MNPIKKRIEVLDYLRGLALFGIIFANILPILENFSYHHGPPSVMYESHLDVLYNKYLNIFVEAKFFSIFSLLFGIGFYIFFHNAKNKNANPFTLYVRRSVVLLLIGIVHQIFQPGEALLFYSIIGLFLLPLTFVNRRINLVIGLILLIVGALSGNKLTLVPALFVLGYVIGQYDIHRTIYQHKKALRITFVFSLIGFVISLVLLHYFYILPTFDLVKDQMDIKAYADRNNFYSDLTVYTAPFISLFYILFFVMILESSIMKRVLVPFKFYGQMALTNYLLNTALILLVGQWMSVGIAMSGVVSLLIIVFQMLFSMLWLRCFRYGPLEYIWRLLTYLQFFGIRRT
ncbi:DUF418 domain-containing protein [Staphylococcus pseudintermedius]|uniref:DUF418 domain-containing protein n=1 Tax=Staphylococcus pseudintermedius TaxID=283734 RepID=UPI0018E1A2DB|nr:DUF418 domain-containing protein [Staphylococcus pseudintermedius]EGQ0315819.1 DUF418 domain-containing protein [Staphylococcus pseudintermedius]EGQ0362106.1 DUF418 domain-containing protein [Staphylococcus pseudintermedius]EGQ0397589.1 DUF418 domain-containing protein [Staphylococcus pseudintermedius]EGQ1282192.1 DUF418 domain-containing protein [Staphylococcus pseudintermedius]EGQ1294698.1 DUF418 domain-containing protein [Staphylococcus pseudintermedius]